MVTPIYSRLVLGGLGPAYADSVVQAVEELQVHSSQVATVALMCYHPRRERPRVRVGPTTAEVALRREKRHGDPGGCLRLCSSEESPVPGREQTRRLSGYGHVPWNERLRSG